MSTGTELAPAAKTKLATIARVHTARTGGSIYFRYDNTPGAIVFKVFNYLFLSLLGVATLYPFVYVFSQSISDLDAVARGAVKLFPVGFSPLAYRRVLTNSLLLTAYKNTIIYSVSGVALHLFCLILVAYPLSIRGFYGKSVMMAFFAFTMFFSGGLVPTYLLVKSLGMINTMWAIIVPGAFGVFYIIIMRTNFQNIPESLRESAYMDGASHIRILFSIVLPLSMPILATLFLFIIVSFWNEFFTPLLYINELKKQPLQVLLRQLIVQNAMGVPFVKSNDPGVVKLVTHPSRPQSVSIISVDLSTIRARSASDVRRIRSG